MQLHETVDREIDVLAQVAGHHRHHKIVCEPPPAAKLTCNKQYIVHRLH